MKKETINNVPQNDHQSVKAEVLPYYYHLCYHSRRRCMMMTKKKKNGRSSVQMFRKLSRHKRASVLAINIETKAFL